MALATPLSIESQPAKKHEFFARKGVNFWQRIFAGMNEIRVPSPDGLHAIVAERKDDGEMLVHVLVRGKRIDTYIGSQVNCEVGWAPDSKAFFVTYSEGGLVGFYSVDVYYIESSRLRVLRTGKHVEKDYWVWMKPIACGWPDGPNIVAIKWIEDSSRLLVAAQIPPHSVCDSFGTFKVYEIALPDARIVKRYEQIEAKKLFWQDMGFELRAANDECIRNPKSCQIAGNHQKKP